MTRPNDIPKAIYEWAEIFCDENIYTDDRELVARAFMAGQAAPSPVVAGLTPIQAQVLEFVKERQEADGFAPSYAEIAEAAGMSSKSQAHRAIHQLIERGAVTMLPGRGRTVAAVGRA